MRFFYNLTMKHFIRFTRLHLSVLTTNDKVFNICIDYTLQNEILISFLGRTHARTQSFNSLDFV